MKTSKFLSICIMLLLFFSVHTYNASAHALSASYTQVDVQNNKASIHFLLDDLSVIEYVHNDTNKDGKLDEKELRTSARDIEKMFTKYVAWKVNNKPAKGKITTLSFEQKKNTHMVAIDFVIGDLAVGDTLLVQDQLFQDSNANYANFLTVNQGTQTSQVALQGDNREWSALLTENQEEQGKSTQKEISSSNAWESFKSFFTLGMHHILTGYDHLLFLLALLIRKQPLKNYVYIVTAFTLAHSLTLTLAVLNVITLPSKFVESVIAISICYVAFENIFKKEVSKRWLLTFAFGLIHGLGFAGALKETVIPKSQLAVSLISFNLGIEFVQLILVLITLPILTYIAKQPKYQMITRVVSAGIIIMGAIWVVQRIFFS